MADRTGRVVPRYWEGVAAALFLLVAADLLTTVYAARAVGVGAEANPLVRWALRRGVGTLVAVNLVALLLLVGLFYALAELLKRTGPDRRRSLAMLVEVFIGLLLFAGLAVVANNAAVIVSGGAAG